jgi:hypothetical protein
MKDLIEAVNARRHIPHSGLASAVKSVAVILCSPRSGSSLLANILASHPDIASLDGEVEPHLALAENGFGYNSDSDAIKVLANSPRLADDIMYGLGVSTTQPMGRAQLGRRWSERLLLQFPTMFLKKARCGDISQAFAESLHGTEATDPTQEQTLHALILSKVFGHDPWKINFYDGLRRPGRVRYFDGPKIEEPPFVCPRYYTRPFNVHDVNRKVLLFKTPSDVYRFGMYEDIFPNAKVKYIHLTRGYAQTVNGLMDGWLSPVGFFSHDLGSRGMQLKIEGYSDVVPFGTRWWKFDLPPNWREFASARLADVCLNQWCSAHDAILASGLEALRVSFEDFLVMPERVVKEITDFLDLEELVLERELPITMATSAPRSRRWTKRKELLLTIGRRKNVVATMEALGYDMNPDNWL